MLMVAWFFPIHLDHLLKQRSFSMNEARSCTRPSRLIKVSVTPVSFLDSHDFAKPS